MTCKIVVLVWCIVDPPYPREETYNVISPTLVESQAFCAASTDSRQFAVLSMVSTFYSHISFALLNAFH